MKRVLIPMPTYGADPSEMAIPWLIMKENNIKVTFTTPNGQQGNADEIMLTGKPLGI